MSVVSNLLFLRAMWLRSVLLVLLTSLVAHAEGPPPSTPEPYLEEGAIVFEVNGATYVKIAPGDPSWERGPIRSRSEQGETTGRRRVMTRDVDVSALPPNLAAWQGR